MSLFNPLVFIIEDDPVYQKYLSKVLSENGIKSMVFSDGEKGVNNLNHNPDLVILDFSLKGLNGLDTLKAIKENHTKTLTFVLTGLEDPKLAEACIQNGAEDFLQKDEESIQKIISVLEEIKSNKTKNKTIAIIVVIAIIVSIVLSFL